MPDPNRITPTAMSGNTDPATAAGVIHDMYTLGGSLATDVLEVPNPARRLMPEAEVAVSELADDILTAEGAEAVGAGYEEAALYVSPQFRHLLAELHHVHDTQTQNDAPEDLSEVAHRFETQGFVREAPTFASQVEDSSRTTPFNYYEDGKRRPKITGPKTEHEGLVELSSFLALFESVVGQEETLPPETAELLEQARSMRENLTFIGEKELTEAARGLGGLWKSYLDGDPARKICVLTEVSNLGKFKARSTQKSDVYLRDKVMSTFTEDELARYGDRIAFSMEDFDTPPKDARVIMLDDWTISGSQMRSVHAELMTDARTRRYIESGCLEINVVTASQSRIERGLAIDPYDASKGSIRTRAYYKAHHAPAARTSGQAHITGLHCAVNYGFYHPCRDMKDKLRTAGFTANPALTRVCQVYKTHNSSHRLSGSDILGKVLPGLKGQDGPR